MEINSNTKMNDLIIGIEEEYKIQRQIYNTYQKAAELDLDFKASKDKEHEIRRYIAIRLGIA